MKKTFLIALSVISNFLLITFIVTPRIHSQTSCQTQSTSFGAPGTLQCSSVPETLVQATGPVPVDVTASGGARIGGGYFTVGLTPATTCPQSFSPQIDVTFSQPVSLARIGIVNGFFEAQTYTATSNNGTAIKVTIAGQSGGGAGAFVYFAETGITHIAITPDAFISTYPPAYWTFGLGIVEFVAEQDICSCFTLIPRPAPQSLPNAQTPNTHGWSMDVEVSDNEGLVLRNVKLLQRHMAKKLSVPYYLLTKNTDPRQRLELKPNSDDAYGRSQLVGYYVTTDSEKLVVEATYQVDRIPATFQTCLHITQRYEFYKEARGCEPTSKLPCSRFKPIVKYAFFGPAANEFTINVVQRNHYQDAGIAENGVGVFRDCDNGPPFGCGVNGIVFERKLNPLEKELLSRVIHRGQDPHNWDNIHQTFNGTVHEPFLEISFPDPRSPGCPECIHTHWRWGASQGPRFGGGLPIIPPDSKQDVDIAVVLARSGEEQPIDYSDLVNHEVITDAHDSQLAVSPVSPSPGVITTYQPHEVVFWYSATGHQQQDTFFLHGGFFNASYPNPASPLGVQPLLQDGPTTVTYTHLFENGPTTVTLVDPGTVPSLPPGYAPFNNLVYNVETDAVISGPDKIAFHVPSATDLAVFENLRILHLEKDSLDPDVMRWVDRTILPPDAPAPDFASNTLSAEANSLGGFVIALGNQPLPPNPPLVDLTVACNASPDPVRADNNLTYTITVTNNGPQGATGVVTRTTLSPNEDLISASVSQGSSKQVDGFIVCNLGTLSAGASATITLIVKTTDNGVELPAQGNSIEVTTVAGAFEFDTDFDNNVVITSATLLPDINASPTVSITAPTNGTTLTIPTNITITAEASDGDGSIGAVEFFDNGNSVGAGVPSGPNQYTVTLGNVAVGDHSLLAVATDNAGKKAASGLVNVTVTPPLTVRITSPADEAVVTLSTPIFLLAKANDANGTISQVQYYLDGVLLGTGSGFSPGQYAFIWNNVSAGRHTVTAVATNGVGATATSMPIAITVNIPPTASMQGPPSGSVYTAPASINISASAGDSDGFVGEVAFYANNTFIGPGTVQGNATITGPNVYNLIWSNAPAGVFALKAVARDNSGATVSSSPVTITVNAPPVVSVTSPTNGAAFATPANITIIANASDSGGSISQVAFYSNGGFIGNGAFIGSNQYSFAWNNVAAGSYSLTAVATDNNGATTTSNPINVTVTLPPAVGIVTPANGAVFSAPATITITCNASDSDGSISQVELYANGLFIGTGTSTAVNEFSLTWSNVSVGVYELTATAVDNAGIRTTSAPVSITVSAPALFVTGSTTLNSSDDAVRSRLQAMGYVVTVKDSTSAASADANGKTLVVISSTVSPTALGTKFRTVAVPVVLWEPDAFLNMGMVGSGNNSGVASSQTQVGIINSSHQMAAGLSGIVSVVSAASPFSWGKPNSNATTIATLASDATRVVIFGYNSGATMPGLVAPAKRVGLFMNDTTATSLNSSGWALFEAAVRWAISDASLSANVTLLPATGSLFDLTAEGSVDWAHWGMSSIASLDRRAGVSQQIGNYALIGAQSAQQFFAYPGAFSWTNGTPTVSASNTNTGILVAGISTGYQITVPADTTLKTLRMYIGVSLAQGRLEATLSDNSAPQLVDTYFFDPIGTTGGIYTISFKAGSSGQVLTLKYTVSGDFSSPNGSVQLASATLFTGYPPTVSITTPAPGSDFTAPANITINATASDNDGTVSKVDFYVGNTFLGTDTSSPYSFTWPNVAQGNYTLTARATDNAGNATVSSAVSIAVNPPPPLPAAPSNLTATAISKSQINLAWTDNSTVEIGFKIERSTDNLNFTQIATVGANVVSYQNTGLSRNTTYYYRVRANNASGDSAYSNTASATTPNN